eukprot:11162771-Lingulodinium_polyedra.AAC.1
MRKAGVLVRPAVDLLHGPRRLDLCGEAAWRALRQEVVRRQVSFVRLGVPCATFSAALRGRARLRSARDPVGPESVEKIRRASFVVRES